MNSPQRIMALDIGDKRIGVAVSDPLLITARPYTVLHRSETLENDISKIGALIKELNVITVVVGLPLTTAGQEGSQAQKVLSFVEKLKESLHIEIVLEDERFTTVLAKMSIKCLPRRKSRQKQTKKIDALAAERILESYLNRIRKNER